LGGEADEKEGESAYSEAYDHDGDGEKEDTAATDAINVMEGNDGEDEVCYCDAKRGQGR
jgi:hypothetical protein